MKTGRHSKKKKRRLAWWLVSLLVEKMKLTVCFIQKEKVRMMARNLRYDYTEEDNDEFESFERRGQKKKVRQKQDSSVRQQRKERARQRDQELKNWKYENEL